MSDLQCPARFLVVLRAGTYPELEHENVRDRVDGVTPDGLEAQLVDLSDLTRGETVLVTADALPPEWPGERGCEVLVDSDGVARRSWP